MELGLHLHRWERREPDWMAAAVAGFAAGAVLMVMELVWAALASTDGPWRISQLVAAITMGPGTLLASPHSLDTSVVAVALATHYVLGVAFGMLLGFIIAGFHYDSSVLVMQVFGAVFGVLLYLFNFHVITQIFPWFVALRAWGTLVAHLIFGIVTALLYWKLARRGLGAKRAS